MLSRLVRGFYGCTRDWRVLETIWTSGKYYRLYARELETLSECAREALESARDSEYWRVLEPLWRVLETQVGNWRVLETLQSAGDSLERARYS